MDNLKPCPFCGEKVAYWHDAKMEPVGVQCQRCGLAIKVLRIRHKRGETFGDAQQQIAERWNRRALHDER